jgi:tetratricopeptide (TPR) repeat protein
MAVVYLARDLVLGRLVAVKLLDPGDATAERVERFLREARHAGALESPNIVRVHHSNQHDGAPYYIMDYVPGKTLAQELQAGPLSRRRVLALGRDLLKALTVAHGRVIHRDIKPSNIFLHDGRALLADFGVARTLDPEDTQLTRPDQLVGTLKYMAPEQIDGGAITTRTDLYAVGLVLFEAFTGRSWPFRSDPEKADWSGVPRLVRPALRKALQTDPARRWKDAPSFAKALERGALGSVIWPAGAALTLVAAVLAWHPWKRPPPLPHKDLAIFPLEVAGLRDTTLGPRLAGLTGWYFYRLPGVSVVPDLVTLRKWRESSLLPEERLPALTRQLGASYGVSGSVRPNRGVAEVVLNVLDNRDGSVRYFTIRGDPANPMALADSIGLTLIREVLQQSVPRFRSANALFRVNPDAVPDFFLGEEAFARDAWLVADQHYARALAIDSTFVLAAWRIGNVRRWMPLRPDPPFPANFRSLYQAHRDLLPAAEQHLIDAQFAPGGVERFKLYQQAVSAPGADPYANLLYGDELFHRGPLSGHALDTAVARLRLAVQGDGATAPAWEHLTWALIRMGRKEEAHAALDSLLRVAARPEDSPIPLPLFLRLAYALRFEPAMVGQGADLLHYPDTLALAARGAMAFDIPEAQLQLAGRLAAMDDIAPDLRASAHVGQGVSLVALGRLDEGLAQFDSAAAHFPVPGEARLQAAEWRVLPPALGVPGIAAEQVTRGRQVLGQVASDSALGSRAAWALALDAAARGDTVAAQEWEQRANLSATSPMAMLLSAQREAVRGQLEKALDLSAPALASDSAGFVWGTAGYRLDPFLRSALHLLRGAWLARVGQPDQAERAWLWYENTDVVGWPGREAQPAEVDWALSTLARGRRALLLRQSDPAAACRLLSRIDTVWRHADARTAAWSRDSLGPVRHGCRA